MGIEIDRVDFSHDDHRLFEQRLQRSLAVLRALLSSPGFGEGEPSLGAELELSLVDEQGRPRPRNTDVLAESTDPRLTFELDRFNLEANLRHGPLAGASFSQLTAECEDSLAELCRAAAPHDARPVMIGILPTLARADLGPSAMTDCLRYEALSRSLRALRDEPFLLDIHGEEDLRLECDDVSFEGAATSFQLHLRVSPSRFANVYDAIQLTTPLALALSANSPTFLGRRLWHETRIALFKQAVDHRTERGNEGRPARVSFGEHWTRDPFDLFAESVAAHSPLLPVLGAEDPDEAMRAGRTPGLRELRLHQGTVWRWNRAIYDPAEEGHLRVELRTMPSGPTVIDMMASAAFQVGLALDLAPEADEWRRTHPFDRLHADFYAAAREGIEVEIAWPTALGGGEGPCSPKHLVPRLLPRAQAGLTRAGVASADIQRLLEIVERRAGREQTGASWQRTALARENATRPRDEAIARMFRAYRDRSEEGAPVDTWRLPA